jgi:Ca-activated chloride channel homolog
MLRLGLVVALIALCSAPAQALERARPMGLYAVGASASLAMVDSRIEVTVRGPILETVVVQRFRNTSGHATEATYIFPLPADAAVSALAIQIGGRTIRGAIEGREAAQRRYEAAVAAGVGAALLEQERPDVFTQTVSAIPPGGVVEVTLRYDAVARFEAGSWQLVVPMVVAPRRVPGTASGRATTGSGRAPDTDRAPDASRVTPAATPGAGGSTAVTIHFVDEPAELKSPTHELAGTRRDATLSDPRSDHDLVVRWRAPAASAGWVEREGEGGFAAVVVEAPPAGARKPQLRVSLAIDRAATTRGDGDVVERPLVRALLGALDRPDRVRVLGGDAAWSAPADVLAAIERTWATPAAFDLTRVLAAARPEGAAILLISDGLVADDAAAIAAARRLGVPVHVVGIGPAPARATLQQLAAATGGTVRYAIAGDDLAALARAVLADLASPPAPLAISWGTLGATEVEPAVLPRLGAGQAMLVVARIRRAQAANARTRGELFAFEALAPARAVDGAITTHGALARRWARERLGDLLAGPHDRNAVTSLATSYGLVSPYTSLVAIGSEVVLQGGVKHSVAVPVSLPAGMQWQAVKQAMEQATELDATGDTVPEAAPQPREAPAAKDAAPPPARPPAPKPEAAKKPRNQPARDEAGEDDAGAATRTPRAPAADHKAAKARPGQDDDGDRVGAAPALTDAELAKLAEQEAKEEVITVTGSTIERKTLNSPSPVTVGDVLQSVPAAGGEESVAITGGHRRLRITAALGGGLVFDHGTRGLAALDARIETNRRTALGVEAALWLIDGSSTEGRVLLGVARRGLARWLELGFGAGVQFGNGTGLATALRLRLDTPAHGLAGYLRYDAAVLLTRPSLEAEHVVTLGIELSY